MIKKGVKGAKNLASLSRGWIAHLHLNTTFSNTLLMIVSTGASVTETPWLKQGSMWYASAPNNIPIRGHSTSTPVLGVGATLSACGAETSTLWASLGFEAGSPREG